MLKKLLPIFGLIVVLGPALSAQVLTKKSNYRYEEAFAPIFYSQGANGYRSASGKPGANYWQNTVDYHIAVHLNTQSKAIAGSVSVDYTNNSPDSLAFLWMQLDQNMFAKNSRGMQAIAVEKSRYGSHDTPFDGGYTIESVTTAAGEELEYSISDTRMQVRLPQEIAPKGGKLQLQIKYHYTIPDYGSDRTGVLHTAQGDVFSVAQWYPRVAVYDDVLGWNVEPYTGPGEFYLEYGNFDVAITTDAKQIVVCGGELLNPEEVYTPTQLKR